MSQFGVAAKALIFKDEHVLILYKSTLEAANDPDPHKRRDLPGGRLTFGESPIEALEREVKEEVNLRIMVVSPVQVWDYVQDNFQLIGIDFLCLWQEGDVQLSEEHDQFEWVSREEIILSEWDEGEKEEYLAAFRLYDCEVS